MRAIGVLLAAALVAGCVQSPAPPDGPIALDTIAIDGRWPFPLDGALASVQGEPPGALAAGEAIVGGVAVTLLAGDARAVALLGAPPAPASGEVVLSPRLAARLGAVAGSRVDVTAVSWPSPTGIVAYEMERASPCGASVSGLCYLPAEEDGDTRLMFRAPVGSSDLRFHPDEVELRPGDYPASWTGTFTSPSGRETPFATAARAPGVVDAPGELAGPLEPGVWKVRFSLEANVTRVANAFVGFVTYHAPGYRAFDGRLLFGTASDQTRAVLANASTHARTFRVAAVADLPRGDAWTGIDDARTLLGLADGDVTALVALAGATRLVPVADAPASVAALRVRPAGSERAPPASTGALVFAAPPDLDVGLLPPVKGAGPPALTFESTAPLGDLTLKGRPAEGARLFAWADPAPWTLAPEGTWRDEATADREIGARPNLVLVAADLLERAGVEGPPTYVEARFEGALGNTSAHGMASVEDGPSGVVWGAASLVAATASPRGVRLVVPLEPDAARADVEARVLAAWARHGVAAIST